MLSQISFASLIIVCLIVFGILVLIIKMYSKAVQGEALVRTGLGDTKVSFSGLLVIPVLHKLEVMDITIKTIMIARTGSEGLICKDNMRADIKVTFFVRVNKTKEDVVQVAQSIGCKRASDQNMLEQLFDAKFSEALKTVGKHFDFVELYNSRDAFKREIIQIIGTDLNGYILDDCAIDYLEQTPLTALNENNILDAEGIKKIIDLTAKQKVQSNLIEREKEKILTKQNVEARETILELEKQMTEKEEKQRREISNIRAREGAEMEKVRQEERLKSEQVRIIADEEIQVAEENKNRQIIVAQKNKEKTEAVEHERVLQAKMLEANERDRIVSLAQIEKEKAVETEKRNIQEVIRERVTVEKATVEEEEKIKDTKAIAEAERAKIVAIKNAEKDAEEALVKEIKAAEAAKQASEFKAKQILIDAEAQQASAAHKAQAMKILADAEAAQKAAVGISEAQVIEAKASAVAKQGDSDAHIIEVKAFAEAKSIQLKSEAQAEADKKLGLAEANVIEVKASAEEKRGLVEAKVMSEKYSVEAKGIEEKASAMKKLDGVGKEHEEFKLKLEKERTVELAKINIQKDIADAQAIVISEALKSARIDIVGGETMFFDQIVGSITKGKQIDKVVENSATVRRLKEVLLTTEEGGTFKDNFKKLIDQFGLTSEDLKNLSISALLYKMSKQTLTEESKNMLKELTNIADTMGIANKKVQEVGLIG